MFPMTTGTSYPTLEKSAVKGKFKYALLPTIPPGMTSRPADGKEAASILSGDNVVVADYSKVKDLALALIKMLTEADEQLNYNKIFGDFPTNNEALTKLAASNPDFGPITEAAKLSVGTPFVGSWSQIQIQLTSMATKNLPNLAKGPIDEATLTSQLKAGQEAAQKALDAEPK